MNSYLLITFYIIYFFYLFTATEVTEQGNDNNVGVSSRGKTEYHT